MNRRDLAITFLGLDEREYALMEKIQRLCEQGAQLAMTIDYSNPKDPNREWKDRIDREVMKLSRKLR